MALFTKVNDEELKLVIVVRGDLKMSKGKVAAQASHAAVNCAFASKKKDSKNFDKWFNEGQKKVVLRVDSLEDLYELKATADVQGLINTIIVDQGRTEIPSGSVTCIGIGPCSNAIVDKITGDLSML